MTFIGGEQRRGSSQRLPKRSGQISSPAAGPSIVSQIFWPSGASGSHRWWFAKSASSLCDLVITHGGFGTVLTALDHGLPLVVIPIAADQPDNARRCVELGVGRTIAPDQRAALREPTFRQNARRIAAARRALPAPEAAVVLLEQLVYEAGGRR